VARSNLPSANFTYPQDVICHFAILKKYFTRGESEMKNRNETFVSDILNKTPQLAPLMQEIEGIEFHDESSKLGALIHHMFENAQSTNVSLNRVIIYTLFNCICKTIEAKQGFILLFNNDLFSSAFSLNRTIFELWAAACFVEKTVRDFYTSRNEAKLTKIANKLFAGTRYPTELPWDEPSTDKPVHINEMLAELKQCHPGAEDTYGFLCEYCHPNFLYNMEAYLASSQDVLWENPRFREKITMALEKQFSSLLQALRGIKACTRAILDMCLKEYGVDYP